MTYYNWPPLVIRKISGTVKRLIIVPTSDDREKQLVF